MNDLAFERELRSTLHALAPADVPASLSNSLATLPDGHRRRLAALLWPGTIGHRLAAATMSLLAVTVVVVLASVVAFGYGLHLPTAPDAGSGSRQFDWHTQVASLQADAVTIDAGGRTFHVPAGAQVHSDPGDSAYQTLELDWTEQGIEQRLYMYFAADNADWWVSQIRTYDGNNPPGWVYYQAPELKAGRGQSYDGNVDLNGSGDHGSGRLRMTNVRLSAFASGTGVAYQPGCIAAGPIASGADQLVAQTGNPPIAGVDLHAAMSAAEADAGLNRAGICHEFRYDYPASNSGQTWCTAPPGNITWWVFGSHGELILFVEAGPAETLAPNAPYFVGCSGAPLDSHETSPPGF